MKAVHLKVRAEGRLVSQHKQNRRYGSFRSRTVANVFFFQAEDGIRDGHVTGVQTCALPISCTCGIDAPMPIARRRTNSCKAVQSADAGEPSAGAREEAADARERHADAIERDRKSVVRERVEIAGGAGPG